jgi:uncharacterized protein YkwD
LGGKGKEGFPADSGSLITGVGIVPSLWSSRAISKWEDDDRDTDCGQCPLAREKSCVFSPEYGTVKRREWVVPEGRSVVQGSSLILASAAVAACLGLLGASETDKKDQRKVELSKEEQRILELTNQERVKKKLPLLRVHPLLCQVARAHSANMAKQGKMSHNLDGKTPRQRATDAGYKSSGAGENIGRSNVSPDAVMKGWLESKGHRETMLDGDYLEIGIGVVDNGKGLLYYTQLFAIPKEKD